MPRVARIKSNYGVYHIIMRGINRQTIFEDEEDYAKFIQTMQKYKEMCEYKIYAYCLMGNHMHLLLKEGKEPLETVMRRICGSYVFWYNKKYKRIGYLFQDRYKSEPVENDVHFLTVLRYIFHNPLKAGVVTDILNYKWTNYLDYLEGIIDGNIEGDIEGNNEGNNEGNLDGNIEENIEGISLEGNTQNEIDFVLNIFHLDRQKAIKSFIEHINKKSDDKCLDITDKQRLTDDEARELIKVHFKIEHAIDIQNFDIANRNLVLKDLKKRYGLSIRQIERVTGISRGVIQRI